MILNLTVMRSLDSQHRNQDSISERIDTILHQCIHFPNDTLLEALPQDGQFVTPDHIRKTIIEHFQLILIDAHHCLKPFSLRRVLAPLLETAILKYFAPRNFEISTRLHYLAQNQTSPTITAVSANNIPTGAEIYNDDTHLLTLGDGDIQKGLRVFTSTTSNPHLFGLNPEPPYSVDDLIEHSGCYRLSPPVATFHLH